MEGLDAKTGTGSYSQSPDRPGSKARARNKVSWGLIGIRSQSESEFKPESGTEIQNQGMLSVLPESETQVGARSKKKGNSKDVYIGSELLPRQGYHRLGLACKGWSRWALLLVTSGHWLPWLSHSAVGPGSCSGIAAGDAYSRNEFPWSE